MYKLTPYTTVIKLGETEQQNLFIPFDPDNTDYQAYLEWVAEGNQPEAADE